MGTLLNRRRYMGTSKQEKVLFEMYNQYFNGTASSVVDTGVKLWDGTHNSWKMEVVYDAITAQYADNITLFTVRPDASPYSGVRVRKDRSFSKQSDFTLTVGEGGTVINMNENFISGTDSYGLHLSSEYGNDVNNLTIIRDGNTLFIDYNGYTATIQITEPKTNNLNLLIGCDYRGTSGTQRYYTGTVQKFVIKELPSADVVLQAGYKQYQLKTIQQ